MGQQRRRTTTVTISADQGVFMISVAAELADMHPQTLRMYEARGLIEPQRSPKGTRLYSQRDVERLRRIQQMTSEWGLNLAGVERVMELENQLARAQSKVQQLERRARQLAEEITTLEAKRDAVRADLVRYEQPGAALLRREHTRPLGEPPGPHRIPVERDGD